MDLKGTLENMKYDKRLVRMNIQNRVIKESDYKKHLQEIDDSSYKLETLGESEEKSKEKESKEEEKEEAQAIPSLETSPTPSSNEVVSNEVASNEVVSNEVASNEVASNEVASNEVVSNEVAKSSFENKVIFEEKSQEIVKDE